MPPASQPPNGDTAALVDAIAQIVARSRRTLVFTGAGISTESGIPDFRGPQGLWKRVDPNLFTIQNFVADAEIRRRSWQMRIETDMWAAEPNAGHHAIVRLERLGVAPVVVTQNIDGLHQAAGSSDVIEIHGTTREFVCLGCGDRGPIGAVLERVEACDWDPRCDGCGGLLKTATISFGQNLDEAVLERAFGEARSADVCLALGSTLSVVPAAYVPLEVARRGGSLVIVNAEGTDLDDHAAVKVADRTGTVLPLLADRVAALLETGGCAS